MERPRRIVRPPGALNDYLTANEAERKSVSVEEEVREDQREQEEIKEDVIQTETDKKLFLSQPYKCGECKARYRSKVALLRHAVKHSGEKPFVCSECGKGLSSQCALSEHMNIHTNNRPHRCDECGLESRQLSVHLRHLLTHQSHPEHLYSCSVCAKTFKQNEYLRKHMRKHTGEKPFVCKECGKSFTCKSELNRHSKRHSSERPHMCSDCGQSFKMRHNLRKHLKAHSGTQQWKCLLCSSIFSKPKLLEAHRKTHLETVQHLQVNRPDDNTLIVSAEGDDRRKLPTVHNVLLPRDNLGLYGSDINVQKKFLRINDTTLPLELILNSVGKGNAIKIKIIDKPAQPRPETFSTCENIVELVDEDTQKQESFSFSKDNNSKVGNMRSESTDEGGSVPSVNHEAVQVASVLSIPDSILSHCLSKHYVRINPACSDYRCWLTTLTSLCQQLCPPYDLEVCKHLSHMTSALQFSLIQEPGSTLHPKSTDFTTSESDMVSSVWPCQDRSQYQFIYKQYMMLMETFQSHFNHHANDLH
ncbi:Zinc finger protein 577-like [Homarus americanus]|uniref:Zinc finger protein 577-like n=2 Tax=Homarus americanus TaxID=6706 RepID=A0A8J5JL22_HOMAM|nr:Zinc finger protein 577-like [Homarus americanus]